MKMYRRRAAPKNLSSDSSDDDEPLAKKISKFKKAKKPDDNDDSSSDSDIGTYLQDVDKIDFNSPFFNLQKDKVESFEKIENDIFAGVTQLTDSNSEQEQESSEIIDTPSSTRLNFSKLQEYSKKLEETKRHVEEYNARKQAETQQLDIENLLAAGESKLTDEKRAILEATLHSSDFESGSDSEKEGWEEVEDQKKEEKEKHTAGSAGLQITVEMPTAVKKKKGVDLLLAIKRRINRVRKENQVLIHKVHLLCWLGHGNYVNSVINSQQVLSTALSLLPSQHCYPKDRTDLSYLESMVKWYRDAVVNVDKPVPQGKTLEELLVEQISKKTAYNKTMLVYIFIAILRSLGIHCRLVLSFQVEPLRPPNSDLHSLSTKPGTSNIKAGKTKSQKNSTNNVKNESKNKTEKSVLQSSNTASKTKPTKSRLSLKKEEIIPKASTSKSISKATSKNLEEKKPNTINSKSSTISKTRPNATKHIIDSKSKKLIDVKEAKNKTRSKSTINEKLEVNGDSSKTRSKSLTSTSKPKEKDISNKQDKKIEKNTKSGKNSDAKKTDGKRIMSKRNQTSKIPQLDGVCDTDDEVLPQVDGTDDRESSSKPNLRKLRGNTSKDKPKIKYKDSSSDDEGTTRSPFSERNKNSPSVNCAPNLRKLKNVVTKGVDVRNDIINIVKSRIKEQKDLDRSKKVKTHKRRSGSTSDENSDYAPVVIPKKRKDSEDDFIPTTKVKRRVAVKPEEDEAKKKKQGMDVWVEVFLETEEKWISVDIIKGQVHCVKELFTRASHPIAYVVAWNNNNTIKDVTRRYCQNFNTVTRKLRIDSKWWDESLKSFLGPKNARDKEEDDELERQQLEKPLPTSIAEYKNHPLYVLKRHLLKFEALYPPDPPPLGFARNEPVYSRQCVFTLHSRDIWMKHAKVVKLGEQPYKIVKARPKWDKLSSKVITDQNLEIFGPWQTQDYDPPTAENGIVPRNAFGNVELFKSCMLPKKTVHLQLPGLNKVAKKLNIDCAAALTGFDFHGGWNHPTYDGYVVCEEFADVLVAAWEEEQGEIAKREREKIDKRVYGNWKKLIRGLLIRERLKAKYEFGVSSTSNSGADVKKKAKGGTTNKRKIDSDSE